MDIFETVPSLESARLCIHRPAEKDAYWVRKMSLDQKVYRYLPGFLVELKYTDKLGAIEYIESYRVEVLGVYRKEQPDELIGLIEIYDYDAANRIASVGYRFRSEFWGKGFASEAVGCVIRFLRNYVNTVTAHVMIENTHSGHVLEKNGFRKGRRNFTEDWDRGDPVLVNEFVYDCTCQNGTE